MGCLKSIPSPLWVSPWLWTKMGTWWVKSEVWFSIALDQQAPQEEPLRETVSSPINLLTDRFFWAISTTLEHCFRPLFMSAANFLLGGKCLGPFRIIVWNYHNILFFLYALQPWFIITLKKRQIFSNKNNMIQICLLKKLYPEGQVQHVQKYLQNNCEKLREEKHLFDFQPMYGFYGFISICLVPVAQLIFLGMKTIVHWTKWPSRTYQSVSNLEVTL